MAIELVSDIKKKKLCMKKLTTDSLQIRIYYLFLKLFAQLEWAVPLLVIVAQCIRSMSHGSGIKNYELTALVIKCLTFFFAFWVGKRLLKIIVNKVSGGLSLDNENETIAISKEGVLRHSYTNGRHRMVQFIPLNNVQIQFNKEASLVKFSGRIETFEEKKGQLTSPRKKSEEILADYYEPSLIVTLQTYERERGYTNNA